MKRLILFFVLIPFTAHAIPIPGKDYNQCTDNADKRYDESRKFCHDHTGGFDRQSCIAIAERHRAESRDDCKTVELVHESLNPHLRVNVGWGSGSGQEKPEEKSAEVSPFDDPASRYNAPLPQACIPSPHNPCPVTPVIDSGFGDFMKKAFGK